MFLTAGLATIGHLCMIKGVKVAELSALQPIKFLQLFWAALNRLFCFFRSTRNLDMARISCNYRECNLYSTSRISSEKAKRVLKKQSLEPLDDIFY